MHEEWRDVIGFEGEYKVSNYGNVLSLKYPEKKPNGRLLTKRISTKNGKKTYASVVLISKPRVRQAKIAVLVAEAFIKNRPEGYVIDHKDGNKQNDNLSNLEWVTPLENARRAWGLGLVKRHVGIRGSKNNLSKLREDDVRKIRADYSNTENSHFDIARRYGVSRGTISLILENKTWKDI